MTSILIVSKYGTIKPLLVKKFEDVNLYKKAGFKSPVNFDCQTIWNLSLEDKKYSIFLYAKKCGKAGQENNYNFPAPVDSVLFFGSCILVSKNENNLAISLTMREWEKIYNHLNNGFDNLKETEDEDDEDTGDEGEIDAEDKTKSGYLKDGFVVEDEDDEESECDEDDGDEDEDKPALLPQKVMKQEKTVSVEKKDSSASTASKKSKKTTEETGISQSKKKKKTNDDSSQQQQNMNENIFLNCKNELTFEEYV